MFPTFAAWFRKNKWLVAALVVGTFAWVLWSQYQYSKTPLARGIADARRDYRNGVYIIHGAGLPTDCWIAYRELLMERYKVDTYDHGCLVSLEDEEYNAAYNEISQTLLKKKYGKDIFAETRSDACEKQAPAERWKGHLSPDERAIAEEAKKGG